MYRLRRYRSVRRLGGETVVLCKRNVPIAEIRALPKRRLEKRPIGLAKGKWKLTKEFFDPCLQSY